MPFVRSGLDDLAYDTPAVSPVFRRVITLENAELCNRVWVRIVDHAVAEQIVIECAVEQERD